MPWSAQKSSAQTEQRCEQASQAQWSCRQITRVAGGRPQWGHASNQADTPLRDRCALNVARRPRDDSSCHSARCMRTAASMRDRKSTRLNSKSLAYLVCRLLLEKKKKLLLTRRSSVAQKPLLAPG